ERGWPAIFGDGGRREILEEAGIGEARLLLLATPGIVTVLGAVGVARATNPSLHIVARAEGLQQLRQLHERGVYEVVQPELEASLELTRQALLHLDVPTRQIQRFTDTIRRHHYSPLFEEHPEYPELALLEGAGRLLEVDWVTLGEDSPLAGRSIGEARIRTRTGATVVAVLRDDELLSNPPVDLPLAAGDRLAVMGDRDARDAFDALARD
ncbi:MAG: TrkA C-terminal domain-containing protein, partial [Acidobacteriota bacterium]